MSNTPVSETDTSRYTGRVKWFNNKTGYGFISVTSGDKSGLDLFVHHTSIIVDSQQYKYLVQGEYVEFNIVDVTTCDHQYQANNVKGISNGKLMCETRTDNRSVRDSQRSSNSERQPPKHSNRQPKEWSVVRNNIKKHDNKDE